MLGVLLNLVFAWWLWNLAKGHFEDGSNIVGWIGLFISAANFAAAMAVLF